jgi:exonuclease III
MATWNARGLAMMNSTDPVTHKEKMRYLQKIAKVSDIIGLQEVHGSASDMTEVFKAMPGWACYLSPSASPAAGGVALLVHQALLAKASSSFHQVLLEGRGLRTHLQFATFALNVITLHLEPAAPRHVHRNLLHQALGSADRALHATFLLADLNLCMPGDCRLHLDNLHADEHDDVTGHWLATTFPNFTIADHDGHTRIGRREGAPSVLSRIDYVMSDIAKPTLLDSRFSAHVLGDLFKMTASDHAAVIAHLHPPRSSPTSRPCVPSWMSSSAAFKDRVKPSSTNTPPTPRTTSLGTS